MAAREAFLKKGPQKFFQAAGGGRSFAIRPATPHEFDTPALERLTANVKFCKSIYNNQDIPGPLHAPYRISVHTILYQQDILTDEGLNCWSCDIECCVPYFP